MLTVWGRSCSSLKVVWQVANNEKAVLGDAVWWGYLPKKRSHFPPSTFHLHGTCEFFRGLSYALMHISVDRKGVTHCFWILNFYLKIRYMQKHISMYVLFSDWKKKACVATRWVMSLDAPIIPALLPFLLQREPQCTALLLRVTTVIILNNNMV